MGTRDSSFTSTMPVQAAFNTIENAVSGGFKSAVGMKNVLSQISIALYVKSGTTTFI